MKTKNLLLLIVLFFLNFVSSAQISFDKKEIEGNNIYANLSRSLNTKTITSDLDILKQLINSNSDIKFRFTGSYSDDLKFIHKKYSLYFKNIEVKGMDFVLHEKNGLTQYVNGNYENLENINTIPKINEEESITSATNFFKKIITSYSKNKLSVVSKGLCIISDTANRKYELSYKIFLDANSVNSKYVYINAFTGEVINYENLVCDINTPGTAQTKYSGSQNFTTDQQGSQYRLSEVRNGVNIKTLNANYNSNIEFIVNNATDFWDTNDNDWTAAEHGSNQPATDAHWAIEKTYDYWLNKHNRNSINNAGMDIVTYVHYDNSVDNAYWYADKNALFLGDGNFYFRPLTALDVCAHELGHGICQYTSNLSYTSNSESQALNEGFSDIWGASVEAYAAPTKQHWLIGEEITQPFPYYLRSMIDPPSGLDFPSSDTYGDANWNNQPDGHYRSGVLNKWYYLLTDGGSGTNGIGNTYNVPGITISKAEKIAYRTELLLNSSANFAMARTMSIQAAQELYGVGSCEEIAVIKAWYAVGVGANYSGPGSSVITGNNNICSSHMGQYSIYPANSSTVWSVSGLVGASVTPTVATTTVVSVPSNVATGTILLLTATVPGGTCPAAFSKQIQISTGSVPDQYSFTPYITQGGNTTYMSNYCNKLTNICNNNSVAKAGTGEPNIISPNSYCASGYITDPTVTSITWSVDQKSAGFHGYYSFTGNQFQVGIPTNYTSDWVVLKCTRTNGCGSAYSYYRFYVTGVCGTILSDPFANPEKYTISPNPSSGQFKISLNSGNTKAAIKEIIITNKMGYSLYRQKFADTKKTQMVNLFGKPSDIYLVKIFDGEVWTTEKLSLEK